MEKNYRAELIGLFGDPVDANPTGVMMEAAFAHDGLNYRYITMKVLPQDLKTALDGAAAAGFLGMNFTMPHKIAVIPLLDELTQAASIIGAVNTAICRNGKWTGDNTDGKGFVCALRNAGTKLENAKVLILGAGGAARAIAVECALAGVSHITVVNRTQSRGQELVEIINSRTAARADFLPWTSGLAIPSDTDILIQGTSVGLFPDSDAVVDINYDTITADMTVGDVVFCPVESLFIRKAKNRGAKVIPGLTMLVEQGVFAYELWTGHKAPTLVMYDTLAKEFE